MRKKWLVAAVPLLLGTGLSLVLNWGDRSPPVILVRMDVGTLSLILGVFASLVYVIVFLVRGWERRQNHKVVLQAAHDRRRFLQRLDHELKNPLTAILAGLANVGAARSVDTHTAALNSVAAQVQRLRRLVAELRKLSDLETREFDFAPCDLAMVLSEAFDVIREQPHVKGRRLNLSLPQAPWPLPMVSGDHDLLFLAVHNLLDNAAKFSQGEDTIELRAFEDGDQVVIEVADTGPGIPEGELPHVWEELYRGEGARGIPGSGLGLALVRAIVQRHQGMVTVRSRSGQGTVFTMRLPLGDVTKR